MRKRRNSYKWPAGFIICLNVLNACNSYPDPVPFTETESEFKKPVSEKIKFTKSSALEWVHIDGDTLPAPVQKSLKLDKLPSKPFSGLNKTPLLKPLEVHQFNPEMLKDTLFNLEKIPAKKLVYKTSILGQPSKVKAGFPRLKDGASESLLMFGQDQGLSGTVVSDFSQDQYGVLWISTDNGLNRFDGEYMEIYTQEQGFSGDYRNRVFADSKGQIWNTQTQINIGLEIIDQHTKTLKHFGRSQGLSNNNVTGILEDQKGRIWISTFNGVNVLDEKEGTIRIIKNENGLIQNGISCLMEDKEGNIWLGMFGKGIDILNQKSGKILHIDSSTGLQNNKIRTMKQNENGDVWIGTDVGVEILNVKEGRISHFNALNGLNTGSRVTRIVFDKLNHAWISTWGAGVEVFDPHEQTIKHLNTSKGLGNDQVGSLFLDVNGQIWMGTYAGEINIYNPHAGNMQHLTAAQGLNNKSTWYYSFLEDAQGRKWIGSLGQGIDILDEKKGTLQHISRDEGLNNNSINQLFPDAKGRIWVGTGSGMNLIDSSKGTIKSWNSGSILDILEDRKGRIWVANNGILVFNENENFYKLIKRNQAQMGNNANGILEEESGEIWVSSDLGLSVIDSAEKTFKTIDNDLVKNAFCQEIIRDSRGLIWVGTYGNGIYMLDLDAGLITQFSVKEGLSDRVVFTVIEKEGKIYVGTGKGISVISPIGHSATTGKSDQKELSWTIKTYGKPQGLARVDHNPASMLTKDGRLWFGISDVLTIMHEPQDDSMVQAPQISGIDLMGKPQYFVNRKWMQSTLKNIDTIWTIKMDSFYLAQNLPPDSGYLQEKSITWDSLSMRGLPMGLKLPYDQNHVTFRFTGTQLANLNKTRYRFILEGLDKEWSAITDKSFVDYRNLSSGNYTFKVSSSGFNGIWSQPATMQFTILPPWWRSGWAYAFYGLCLLGLVFMADRIQRRRVINIEREKTREREFQQAKEMEKAYHELKTTQTQLIQSEKMASLGELTAGIAHEIQNPLNFVTNFSEVNKELLVEMKDELAKGNFNNAKTIANDVIENQEKINHHGKRADAIVKGMLQHSKSGIGVKEPTDINALADEYLRLAYHGLKARDKSFNAKLETDFDLNIRKVDMVPQDIGRVLLNLINNAFYAVTEKKVQSPDGFEPTVSVKTLKTGDKIEISVKDNGKGIPQRILDKIFQPFFTTKPTGQGTGLGLSLSYDIVKAHGGEMKVETKEGGGSEFIIRLPS